MEYLSAINRPAGMISPVAWEWVAPVCTGSVGALGIVVTGLTARGGRRHAETIAEGRIKHERELAEDARTQARLGEAYVELLSIVTRVGLFADAVRPVVDTNPPASPPPLPPAEEQTRADALVMAYGSRAVGEAYEAWRKSVWDIIRADRMIGLALETNERHGQGQSGIDYMETWGRLEDELRPAQREAREALGEAIAVELRSRPPQQPTPPAPTRKRRLKPGP